MHSSQCLQASSFFYDCHGYRLFSCSVRVHSKRECLCAVICPVLCLCLLFVCLSVRLFVCLWPFHFEHTLSTQCHVSETNFNHNSDNSSSSEDSDMDLDVPEYSDYKAHKMNNIDPDCNIQNMKNNCAYYTNTSFNTTFVFDNKISLLHFNSRSLYRNFENIKDYLSQFSSPFNVIAVSETWLNEKRGFDFKMNGYEMFYKNRQKKTGGGAALYIDKNLSCKILEDMTLAVEDLFECITVEIVLQARKTILVSCIYRTPGSDSNLFREWVEKLFVGKTKKDIILCGDYNIDLLNTKKHKATEDFTDTMYSINLYPLITKPTRITNHSATLIDNIFTNILDGNVASGILINDISDHLPIFMVYNVNSKIVNKNPTFTCCRLKSEQALKDFKRDLFSQDWEAICEESDVDVAYDLFMNTFILLYDKHCPMKKHWGKNDSSAPWITKGLANACKKKNYLYKQFLKHKTIEMEQKYKKYKNKLTNILRESKKDYFTKLLNSKKNNIQGMWKVLNMVMGNSSNSLNYPEYFIDNSKIISDEEDIVNRFNNFFVNIGPELAKEIKMVNEPLENLIETNPKSMFLTPTDENELLKIIKACSNKTSQDHNGIDMRTVKYVGEAITKPLTHICNLSFQSGKFPSEMKIAKVLPLFKSGDKHSFTNYRPVSLLPQFSKILEKLFNLRLLNFIEKNNLLSNSQYGFRQNRSTSLALIDLVEEITNCIENNKFSIGIFIDLQKAFDTIDHGILLKKLHKYGIRGTPQYWLQSYLSNRKQFVQFNHKKSTCRNITCGVPQGSILGPSLFLLYINDICKSSKIIKFILFADDTTLLFSGTELGKLLNEITIELHNLKKWFNMNKLSLNLKKTKLVTFGTRKYNLPIQITVDNTIIERVQKNVFLGVVVDEKLCWKPHISHVRIKVAKCIGVMKRCSLVLNPNALFILYHSFIMAYLNYGLEVWGNCYKTNLLPLVTLQKRAIRVAHNVRYDHHTNPLFLNSSNLKLYDLVDLKIAQIMFKASKKSLPANIQALFQDRDAHHEYKLRGTNQLYQPKVRTTLKSMCISVKGVLLWNSLPEEIKMCKNLVQFKKTFKGQVLSNYQEGMDY